MILGIHRREHWPDGPALRPREPLFEDTGKFAEGAHMSIKIKICFLVFLLIFLLVPGSKAWATVSVKTKKTIGRV